MTKTAAAPRTLARLALIALTAIAFTLGLSIINEAQAATIAPTIEAGIPEGQECVLRNTEGVTYLVVADTDPRCKVQGQEAQQVRTIVVVPELATIQTTPVGCAIEQGLADGAYRWESCAPEESPNGGHLVTADEDGSAYYSDGWTIAPTEAVTTTGAVLGDWDAPTTKSDRELLTDHAAIPAGQDAAPPAAS